MTPCGAEPSPRGTWRTWPVFGSRIPSAPWRWAVYQILPSGAGATSWGREPAGSWKTLVVAASAAAGLAAGCSAQAGAAIRRQAKARARWAMAILQRIKDDFSGAAPSIQSHRRFRQALRLDQQLIVDTSLRHSLAADDGEDRHRH